MDRPGARREWLLGAAMALVLGGVAAVTLVLRGGDFAVPTAASTPATPPPMAVALDPPGAEPGTEAAEALAELDRAIRVTPGVAALHRDRGLLLQRLGRHAEALVDLENCLILSGAGKEGLPILFEPGAMPPPGAFEAIAGAQEAIARSREALADESAPARR